ncbi:MAG: TRAM domain-containing protein, partial [Planctomycetes bacterium]|nr:TRAM domain-containing protein [Planctomycetota bacterium]
KLVGTRQRVLIDGPSQDERFPYAGRRYADAPEVDCQVFVASENPLKPGDFVEVKIEKTLGYDLLARVSA